MRYLVTGATGFVGGWVVERALAAGHTVRALVRDGAAAARVLPHGVEVLVGSVTDAARLDLALKDIDVVVHAAAAYRYGRGEDAQLRDNPDVANAVLDAARRAGTAHVIDISSAVVFAPHPDGPLRGVTDLDSPLWPATDPRCGDPYLASKTLAYRDVLTARAAGLPVSSVHPGMVLGPRDRVPGTSGKFLRSFVQDRLIPATYMPWIDVRDLADTVIAVAALAPGGSYLVSRDWVRTQDVAATVDRVTGGKPRRIFLPPGLLKSLATANDLTGGRLDRGLPPRQSLEYLLGNRGHLDGSSGARALGRDFRTTEETAHDAIAWWAANGLLTAAEAGAAAKAGASQQGGRPAA